MQKRVQFRLLSQPDDWLRETLEQIHQVAKSHGRLIVLSNRESDLDQLDQCLWLGARDQFITFKHPKDVTTTQVTVNLCLAPATSVSAPALINLGCDWQDLGQGFNYACEIVLPDDETVDKARRQYKMYRQQGFQIEHHRIASVS